MVIKAFVYLVSLILAVNGTELDHNRVMAYAVPNYEQTQEYISTNPDEIKLCGRNLGDAIFIICGNDRTLGRKKSKRNLKLLAPLLLNRITTEHGIEFNDVDDGFRYKWPWNVIERHNNYASRLKRVFDDDDGVANLCCDRPCSYNTLLTFCKTDRSTTRD